MGRPRNSHNAAYNALQEEYMTARDARVFDKMYGIAKKVAYNYIRKYGKKKKCRFNDIDEKAHDSAVYVMEQYLKHPGFMVKAISSYVWFGVMKTLFKNKDAEMSETSYEEYAERMPR
jgi:hypothetical protein